MAQKSLVLRMCYTCRVKTISQRELRNNSGEIMRGLERGESYQITNRGVLVGTLSPTTRTPLGDLIVRPGTQIMEFPAGVEHPELVMTALAELRGDR